MTSETRWLPVDGLETLRLRKSAKWRTYPADVLPLTVAEMDFGLAPPVQEALRAAVERSDTAMRCPHPSSGAHLPTSPADAGPGTWTPRQSAAVPDVGVGVVELLRVLAHPGDAVVISPPVYPPFFEWASEARTRLVEAPLRLNEVGWRLDFDELEKAFAAHLPSTSCATRTTGWASALERGTRHLADWPAGTGHHRERRDPRPTRPSRCHFTPMLTVPGAAAITVSVLSASKAWNLAGLKCAVIVTASEEMASRVNLLPPDVRWRTGHFGVLATVAAFADGGSWLDELLSTLEQRRTLLTGLLHDACRGDLAGAGGDVPCVARLPGVRRRGRTKGPVPRGRKGGTRTRASFRSPGQRLRATQLRHQRRDLDEATARMARAVA